MIALDTNVVVRFLMHDDEKQARTARTLMEGNALHIPDSVILETAWVLRRGYKLSPEEVRGALQSLLGLKNVFLADPLKWGKVLKWHEAGLDFADALHLANSDYLKTFKTFDKAFAKQAAKLSDCKVSVP